APQGRHTTDTRDRSPIPLYLEGVFRMRVVMRMRLLRRHGLVAFEGSPGSRSTRQLCRDNIYFFDGRGGRLQLGGLCHEWGRGLASHVRLTATVIGKRVEDTECGWPQLECVPGDGGRLLFDNR